MLIKKSVYGELERNREYIGKREIGSILLSSISLKHLENSLIIDNLFF